MVIVHSTFLKNRRFFTLKSKNSQIINIYFVVLAKWRKMGYNVSILLMVIYRTKVLN